MCYGLSTEHQPTGSVRAFLIKACVMLVSSCLSQVSSSFHTIAFEPEHQRIVLSDVDLDGSIREFRPGRLFLRETDDSNTRIQFKQTAASFDGSRPAEQRAARADTDFCHTLGWQSPPQGNQDEARQHSWPPLEWQVSERDLACNVCHIMPHRPHAAYCR